MTRQTNYIENLDPALLRPGRIDRKVQYYFSDKTQAKALFIRFYPASHTTLSSELSTSPCGSDVISEKSPAVMSISERQSALVELAEEFASHVPDREFSTAELQGYLLSCKKNPGRAVSGIAEWVEVERKERKERKEKEEERKRQVREKKEAKEAERLQESLMRIGGTVVISPPGTNGASISTIPNSEGNTGSPSNTEPTSPVLLTKAVSGLDPPVPVDVV